MTISASHNSASCKEGHEASLDGRGPLVLVADDHEDTRFLLRTLLEMRGLGVVEVESGEEAISVAERERPDLILMDGSLPRMDGFSATRYLRKSTSLSAVPIIFLS